MIDVSVVHKLNHYVIVLECHDTNVECEYMMANFHVCDNPEGASHIGCRKSCGLCDRGISETVELLHCVCIYI
jgi:hypothetical protein